jgi:hypothetical protein
MISQHTYSVPLFLKWHVAEPPGNQSVAPALRRNGYFSLGAVVRPPQHTVPLGLGRIVALHHHLSNLYQIF